MGENIVLSPCCHFEVFWFAKHTVCRRESPQDTCIEYAALFCIGMKVAVTVDAAIEAAILAVNHLFYPEGQYVAREHILHLLLEFHNFIFIHYFFSFFI